MAGFVYPDGGAVLDQPVLLLEAFGAIAAARSELKHAGEGKP